MDLSSLFGSTDLSQLQGLLGPSAEDKQKALTMGLLASGIGFLGNRYTIPGQPNQGLLQGGLGGLSAYQGALEQSKKDRAEALTTAAGLMKLKKDMELQDFGRRLLGSAFSTPSEQALSAGAAQGDIGPTVGNEQRLGQMPSQTAPGLMGVPPQAAGADILFNQGKNLGNWMFEQQKPTEFQRDLKLVPQPMQAAAIEHKYFPPTVGQGYGILRQGPNGPYIDPASMEQLALAKQIEADIASGHKLTTYTPAEGPPRLSTEKQVIERATTAPLSANNPGAIMSPSGTLKTFPSMQTGLDAIDSQLKRYGDRGIDTLAKVIGTWAPASAGNNTQAYIADVAGITGLDPNQKLDLSQQSVRDQISRGILMHENGPRALFNKISKGELPGIPLRSAPEQAGATKKAELQATQEVNQPQARFAIENITNNIDNMLKQIDYLRKSPGLPWIVGPVLGRTPPVAGAQVNAESDLNTLKNQIAISVLNAMRQASKTGGAIGQVTEREYPILQSQLGSLQREQTTQQFMRGLKDVEETLNRMKKAYNSEYQGQYPGSMPATPGWTQEKENRYQELKRKFEGATP